jgi:general secretion pathway protein D
VRTLTLGLSLLAALQLASASEAGNLFKQGKKAERAGRFAQAYILYSEAAVLEPAKSLYWLRAQALQSRAALESKATPKPAAGEPAEPDVVVPPEEYFESPTAKDWAEARKPLPPSELKATPGRKDFNLRGNYKELFEQVSKAFGLECVFDADYDAGPTIRFNMDQADYRDALHGLEAATSSFLVPLSDRLFMVVKDTPQKRRDVEPSVSVTVVLPEPTQVQDLTMLIAAVQQSLGLEKVAWDTQKNTVVIRDRISKVKPALLLFNELLQPRSQVVLDVDFVEVNRSEMLNYGLDLQTTFPLINFSDFLGSKPGMPTGVSWIGLFGGGASLFGIGIANAQLFADMSQTGARTLLHSEIRSLDNQPATLHVGDRYPILTAGYFGPASFTNGQQAYTPPPSFNFEDLGFTVKVTPQVHGMEDVSLDLEADFKLLAGQAINGIPIIANRQMKSKVRLRQGEWGVIAGIMTSREARTISGIPGLATLPGVGRFLRHNSNEKSNEEVLVLIRPRLIGLPPSEAVTHTIPLGSEQRPITPL